MQLEQKERWHLPHVGQRIIKTGVAVFICLLVYRLFGFQGESMPTEAIITAIICMQPYVRDSREYAINRMAGTLVGGGLGLLLLLLLAAFPVLGRIPALLYGLMALGVMASLYMTVLLRKPDTASLAAIVFMCVVIAFPDIEAPLNSALDRIVGVLLGTLVAITVNVFRLPRGKVRNKVFFVRMADLVPDRMSRFAPAVLFRLNYLYNDGAKICLMNEHAPAFFLMQMSEAKLSVPMIVMDGAAIYDVNANRYLEVVTIPAATSAWLREELDRKGLSYCVYTIHRNKTCIFHQGELSDSERLLYEQLRRSPYRSYLEGEIYREAEIVYYKIIDSREKVEALERHLKPWLAEHGLRTAVRRQNAGDDVWGLYVYSAEATMAHAERRLMEGLREQDPTLEAEEIFSRTDRRTERDAMILLHQLENAYEPVQLFARKKRAK